MSGLHLHRAMKSSKQVIFKFLCSVWKSSSKQKSVAYLSFSLWSVEHQNEGQVFFFLHSWGSKLIAVRWILGSEYTNINAFVNKLWCIVSWWWIYDSNLCWAVKFLPILLKYEQMKAEPSQHEIALRTCTNNLEFIGLISFSFSHL